MQFSAVHNSPYGITRHGKVGAMIQDENRFVAGWEGHGFSFNNGKLGKSCLGRVLQPVSDEWKALAVHSTKQGLRYAHIRAEGFEVVNTK